MKVIGQVPTSGSYGGPDLLVQMSQSEARKLQFADGYANYEFKVGDKLDINSRYDRLGRLESNRRELDSAIGKLKVCVDVLEPLGPLVSCDAPPPEVAKEGGDSNG